MHFDPTRQLPVVDILHGVPVADPYRWMEDRLLPETEAWILEQHRIRDDYFARVPGMELIRARVRRYLDTETVEQPARIGDRLFFRRRRTGEEQASLWVRSQRSGAEYRLVDPSGRGPFAAVTIHRISDDGRLMAFEERRGGDRAAAIGFVDVDSGEVLPDRLPVGYPRGLAFDSGSSGFYYCHETDEDLARGLAHTIRYHRMGAGGAPDPVLLSIPRAGSSSMRLVSDEHALGAVITGEDGPRGAVHLHLAVRTANRSWSTVFEHRPAPCGPHLHGGRIFVYCSDEAPLGRILELNLDGSRRQTVVPEYGTPIYQLQFFEDMVLVMYLVNLEPVVHLWSTDGVFLGRLRVPGNGSFRLLGGYSSRCDALFATFESFHQPPALLAFDPRRREFGEAPLGTSRHEGLDDRRFTVVRTHYQAKDETSIPLSLVIPGEQSLRLRRTAILTAYGGFGIPMTPRFSALVAVMLELGAVFALPNIRGGGEFGRAWHEAARGPRRQVAFDDFIAAAEWLHDQDLVAPDGLAIFGGSNSGLLAGVAMTQRPDLFQAVIAIAPVLDMVRYEHFGSAAVFRREFGSVSDPSEFGALHAYSPYHRVADGINYPATLFVTGDRDRVCDPAHTRKMAARLQDRGDQSNPILVDYHSDRGHAAVLPLSLRIEALSRRIAFLCHELKISIPGEEESASAGPPPEGEG